MNAHESTGHAEFAALKREVEEYIRGPGERWAERIEREHAVPLALWDELRERGLLDLAAPREFGGRGIPFTRYLELMEIVAMSHAAVRMIVHVVNGIWRALDRYATPEQRERFVKPTVTGRIKVAFTLTEPEAGTGADLRCAVERRGDTYYLSGQKHLITFGSICDYWLLFARLAGTSGADGTVALMVPRQLDRATVERMPESMGVRGSDHARLRFDAAPVPVANRLGEEGQGLDVALGGFLAPSRISVAMSCVGLARRAFELAVERARTRETFGKPLYRRQAIAFMAAEMGTDIAAARELTMRAAREWEAGGAEAQKLSSMAKLFATSMLQRVTDQALQIHGGIGYWEPHPIERIYRDARAQRFEEGTNEIQKTVIAREIFSPGREGETMKHADKIALITGGTRGIGRTLALTLAREGATLVLNYKQNETAAQETIGAIEALGASASLVKADLEEPLQIDALFEEVKRRHGRLDYFISNAAASAFKRILDLNARNLDRTYALNVRAFVLGAVRAVPLMRRGGRIAVMSSYGSARAYPTYANLGAAKAAIEAWVRYMALEFAPYGINVNAVSGGLIETDSLAYFYGKVPGMPAIDTVLAKTPKGRPGTAQEMADVAAFLLSPESEYITGQTLVVDGGLSLTAPPFYADAAPPLTLPPHPGG